ncbi:serine hydrolase family protein [Delftia acidovorans]|uniref:Alpha/beta hydrolase n=1 Tax=Delftia tsuruhatensis TaxID=180282 RepID=A0ABN4SEU5_9BURK|nr:MULTISPECIES: alpha/beta hydrolase [Delftia]AOU99988.1 alpha/beta hydrolase [Delftia tsuruhatensis]KFJ08864.1 serine hydrolase family protein [Delftia acidovorans]MDH0849622.1 alpha/beta hydrolase [Delftia tsuruhatensis]MDH2230682.1 alpha/beta hydrolase [Delftia tsuruhatensis]QQB48252.1 serine hydrolase family protein [Delftia acidovorans]
MNPHRIIIVPGWRNSGPDHWQSLWAQQLPHAERVEQDDWLVPHREPWVAALEQLVLSRPEPVVLAAHSLGCITAAHLGPEASARVRGALLVAPADPERRAQLADFAPVPYAPLPYRSVLVASSNDPYCPIRRAGAYARAWGSEFVRLQNAGHINVESGFGDWPLGLALLQSLMQGDSWQPAQPRPAVRSPRSPRPPRVAAAHASVSAGTGAGAPWAAGL